MQIDAALKSIDAQIFVYKDILNHLYLAMNLILNLLSEIETSITFCKLGVLHHSIINSEILEFEMSSLSINVSDVLTYESLINVKCTIRRDRIVYFLTLPVYEDNNYHLFYLHSVPWWTNTSFSTIIPTHKHLLMNINNGIIKPLSDRCVWNDHYYCNIELLSQSTIDCERSILFDKSLETCKFTKIQINNNQLLPIPDTNQLLVIFPTEDQVEIKGSSGVETRTLQGIYLVDPGADSIYYHKSLMKGRGSSIGRPHLLSFNPINLNRLNYTPMSIDEITLKNIDNFHLNLNPVLNPDENEDYWYPSLTPSCWTIVLYLSFGALILYTCINYRKSLQVSP
uniref:tRNA(Ile)-lysidine synthase n=1 Tax=Lygus hesperus TaxID=30085 RepID=A0A0A9X0Q2_LYGHE